MNLIELKKQVEIFIGDLKNKGIYPKENDLFDYKAELNFFNLTDNVEIFMRNFSKDILSFSNGNGGILLLGIKENQIYGGYLDDGLDNKNLELLNKIDINLIVQKFEKILKTCIEIDIQQFQISTRKFFYILIAKQNQILIPINDFQDYKLKKGEIIYRLSGKNEVANNTTQDFNRFLQIKTNEKSKEFMEIWTKLLPEMFDINPKEILIINPKNNKIYGFNEKDNVLSSSNIDIDKSETGIFNIILNAISAGDIGKISDTEGKPLYKIIGEIKSHIARDYKSLTTLNEEVMKIVIFNFTNPQLKAVIKYLDWVTEENFKIENPSENTINKKFINFIWIETLDKIKKIVFSKEAISEIAKIINDKSLHLLIFKKELKIK